MSKKVPRRVGVVGYGKLGKFLVDKILADPLLELAFVWNRSRETLGGEIDQRYILNDLNNFCDHNPDIVVEVAHPCISADYGAKFLKVMSNLFCSFSSVSVKNLMLIECMLVSACRLFSWITNSVC